MSDLKVKERKYGSYIYNRSMLRRIGHHVGLFVVSDEDPGTVDFDAGVHDGRFRNSLFNVRRNNRNGYEYS